MAPDSSYMVAITRRHPTCEAGSAPLSARLPPDDPVVVRWVYPKHITATRISGIKHSDVTFQAVPRTRVNT